MTAEKISPAPAGRDLGKHLAALRDKILNDQGVSVADIDRISALASGAVLNAPVADQKHLPGWERGIPTITMTGYQLRAALEFINPGGDDEPDERDNDLTFGIVQHKDDAGTVSTGLCCWNDDSDGVLPLDAYPEAAHAKQGATPAANRTNWTECERIADLPAVDEALLGFSEDPTGDNGTMVVRAVLEAVAPEATAPALTVWYGPMPESNGKSNFTALLVRKGGDFTDGITIDRSEYPDRVRYEADRVRYLIGELAERPFILDYDADKHSGYAADVSSAAAKDADLPEPLNGIPATHRHDEGAIARCSYCGRYSLDPRTLSDQQPVCDCGEQHGWCGSFKRPGPDSLWSGAAPGTVGQKGGANV
jgi:hypothetical protein